MKLKRLIAAAAAAAMVNVSYSQDAGTRRNQKKQKAQKAQPQRPQRLSIRRDIRL